MVAPAQAHGDGSRDIDVVRIVDTVRDRHSVVVIMFGPAARGSTVTVGWDEKRLWRCGPLSSWQSPAGECAGFKQGAYSEKKVTLPRVKKNRIRVSIPVDVADRPGRLGTRDVARLTFVTVRKGSDWQRAGYARVITPRAGDPRGWLEPYSWRSGWDHQNGSIATHLHRTIVRR